MLWEDAHKEFGQIEPRSDDDRAAQLIVARLKSATEVKATYRSAPDLFNNMTHPRLNTLILQLFGPDEIKPRK